MQIKLFVGTRLTPELGATTLLKIPHEGKEYVGSYVDCNPLSINDLRHTASSVQMTLQNENPHLRIHSSALVVFPELFCG